MFPLQTVWCYSLIDKMLLETTYNKSSLIFKWQFAIFPRDIYSISFWNTTFELYSWGICFLSVLSRRSTAAPCVFKDPRRKPLKAERDFLLINSHCPESKSLSHPLIPLFLFHSFLPLVDSSCPISFTSNVKSFQNDWKSFETYLFKFDWHHKMKTHLFPFTGLWAS